MQIRHPFAQNDFITVLQEGLFSIEISLKNKISAPSLRRILYGRFFLILPNLVQFAIIILQGIT